MIFVAVGTQKFPFDRLLKKIDELSGCGDIQERVFAQIGNSTYIPKNYEYSRFLTKDEFLNNIKECDVLVTHSGVSTIISGLKLGKPTIVVPRLAKFGEHVDDHQLEIAESFEAQNFVLLCENENKLLELVNKSKEHVFSKYVSQRQRVIEEIQNYLQGI